MHKLGTYALTLGAVLTVLGLLLGFGFMFSGAETAIGQVRP